ncbi:MAG: hypothetical protein QGG88_10300 [Gammaproteobacteria bacterium]|jgi:hypothetical protein|nr:hypothetical protein [Gammaproteobacteria bacterium]
MQPLDLYLKPSRYLTIIAIIGWILLVSLCLTVNPPWWQSLVFAVVALWRLIIWLRHYAWLQTDSSLQRIQAGGSGWRVSLANGVVCPVQLVSGCRFIPGLIVLHFTLPSKRKLWWLLLADSADIQALRRLRVWGRWGSS